MSNQSSSSKQQTSLAALTASLRQAQASRAERRALGAPKKSGTSASHSADAVVQSTDGDAAGSRISAVNAGYIDDDFAHFFTATGTGQDGASAPRRQPIINRGTYVRTERIDAFVHDFLDGNGGQYVPKQGPKAGVQMPAQIISLGAGTDTRFWRMRQQHPHCRIRWHELDFPESTQRKVRIVRANVALSAPIGQISGNDEENLLSEHLNIRGVDLRDLRETTTSSSYPQSSPSQSRQVPSNQFVPELEIYAPTLIFSEMCLTYLPQATSTSILRTFLALLEGPVQVLLYEPLHPHDAFGRTMTANLASRGIRLHGLEELPTLEHQKQRLRDLGLGNGLHQDRDEDVRAWTVKQVWDEWVNQEEKDRLRGLEMVDEEEEWVLLAEHYGFIHGARAGA